MIGIGIGINNIKRWGGSGGTPTPNNPVVNSFVYDAITGITLNVTDDVYNEVTCYWASVVNPNTPSEAQIIAGTGGGILDAGSFAVTVGGDTDLISISDGSANEIHIVITNASGGSTGNPSVVNNTITSIAAITTGLTSNQFALGGQDGNSFAVYINDVPIGTTDLTAKINDVTLIPLGGSIPGTYRVSGLDEKTAYRVEILATTPTSGGAGDIQPIRTVIGDPISGMTREWKPAEDLGVVGDWFVDPLNGSDVNGGTTVNDAFATAQAAHDAASPGDVIKVLAGKLREQVIFTKSLTVEGYGDHKPEFTAAMPLSGLTRCSSADVSVLGPLLGIDGSTVFKTTLSTALVEHGGYGAELNLYECDGIRMEIATDRDDTSDLFVAKDSSTFHVADNFVLNGSNQIVSIVDASVINSSRYTDAGLIGASIYIYHNPNLVSVVTVTSADVANNTITVDGLLTVQGNTATPDPDHLRYSITNVPQALTPGTFFASESGGTITVYLIPTDEENINFIEYSARPTVFTISASIDNVTLRGIHTSKASGNSGALNEGINIYGQVGTAPFNSGRYIDNCLTTATRCSGADSRGVYIQGVDTFQLTRSTSYEHEGQHGIGRGIATTRTSDWLIDDCLFIRSGAGIMSGFFLNGLAAVYSYADDSGTKAHASLMNFYGVNALVTPNEGCNDILLHGFEFGPNCTGAFNFQRTSNVTLSFSEIPAYHHNGTDNRTIDDTNVYIAPGEPGEQDYSAPEANGRFEIINCHVPPMFGMTDIKYAIEFTSTSEAANGGRHSIENTITESMSHAAKSPNSDIADHQSNIINRLFTAVGQSSADFDFTNTIETTKTAIWNDPDNGDFSPAVGSPILTTPGKDKSVRMGELAATFPQVTTWTDMRGNVIDWSVLPIGPNVSLSFVRNASTLTLPAFSNIGSTTANGNITTDDASGTLYAALYPTNSPPTDVAAIKAGTGASFSTSTTTHGVGIETFNATGLTITTEYRWWFIQNNGVDDSNIAVSEPFTTLAVVAPSVVNTATVISNTSYQAGPNYVYTGTGYTPSSDDNILIVGVAAGAANNEPIVKWRGGTALTNTQGRILTSSYIDAFFIYVIQNPGTTSGVLTVQQDGADDTNSCIAMIMEVQDVNGTPVVQAGGYSDQVTTSLTSASYALTSCTEGNSVFGFSATGGDATGTAAANDATLVLNAETGTSGSSDIELTALSAEDISSGTITLGITMSGASHAVIGSIEITS